ncbi:MAG: hypothetical protein ACYTG0_37645 [Planctomycetota bacterium]|jgi:hypothetical protein
MADDDLQRLRDDIKLLVDQVTDRVYLSRLQQALVQDTSGPCAVLNTKEHGGLLAFGIERNQATANWGAGAASNVWEHIPQGPGEVGVWGWHDKIIHLEPMAWRIAEYVYYQESKKAPKDQVVKAIWQSDDTIAHESRLKTHCSNATKAWHDAGIPLTLRAPSGEVCLEMDEEVKESQEFS